MGGGGGGGWEAPRGAAPASPRGLRERRHRRRGRGRSAGLVAAPAGGSPSGAPPGRPAGVRRIRVAKSPASPAVAFACHVTAAGLAVLEGVQLPDVLGDSVIEQAIQNDVAYEEDGI